MARACAARYRKQARGACQAAATALAVVASGLALTSVLLPVLAGAATIVTGVGPAARALGTGAAAALGLGAWALVRGMTATRRPAGRKAWRRSGTGCGRRCAAAVALAAAALWIGGAAAWKNTAAPTLAGAGALVLAGAAVKVALARVGALPFAVLAAAAAFALGEPPETAAALLGAGAVSVVYRLAAALVHGAAALVDGAAAPRARAPSECLRRLVLWGVPLACVDGAPRRLLVAAAAVYYAFPGAARRWRRASDRRRSRRRGCRAARVARVAVLVLGPLDGVASAAARRNPSQRSPPTGCLAHRSNADFFTGRGVGGPEDGANNCVFEALRDAARAARHFDRAGPLRDFDALRRAMGVEVGAPLPCDALHRLADVLGVVIVLVHDSGQACYGSTRARRWRAVVEVDGAGDVLHAVRAGLVRAGGGASDVLDAVGSMLDGSSFFRKKCVGAMSREEQRANNLESQRRCRERKAQTKKKRNAASLAASRASNARRAAAAAKERRGKRREGNDVDYTDTYEESEPAKRTRRTTTSTSTSFRGEEIASRGVDVEAKLESIEATLLTWGASEAAVEAFRLEVDRVSIREDGGHIDWYFRSREAPEKIFRSVPDIGRALKLNVPKNAGGRGGGGLTIASLTDAQRGVSRRGNRIVPCAHPARPSTRGWAIGGACSGGGFNIMGVGNGLDAHVRVAVDMCFKRVHLMQANFGTAARCEHLDAATYRRLISDPGIDILCLEPPCQPWCDNDPRHAHLRGDDCPFARTSKDLLTEAFRSGKKVIIVENSRAAVKSALYRKLFALAVAEGYLACLVPVSGADVRAAPPVVYTKTQVQMLFLKIGDGDAAAIEGAARRAIEARPVRPKHLPSLEDAGFGKRPFIWRTNRTGYGPHNYSVTSRGKTLVSTTSYLMEPCHRGGLGCVTQGCAQMTLSWNTNGPHHAAVETAKAHGGFVRKVDEARPGKRFMDPESGEMLYRALSLLEFVDALGIRNYNIYDDVLVGDLASALGETAGSCAIEAFYRHMKPVIEATLARGPAPGGGQGAVLDVYNLLPTPTKARPAASRSRPSRRST